MLSEWDWLSPTVWLLLIAAIVLLLIFGSRRSARRGQLDEFHVRHEIIDECFAKGEMTREDCERGCASDGSCHASPSVSASLPTALLRLNKAGATRLFRVKQKPS